MRRLLTLVAACCLAGGCGGDSSPSPSPSPTPTTLQLSGTITDQQTGRPLAASVQILDGVNAGRTATTDAQGFYSFGATLASGGFTATATSSHYTADARGINLTANVTQNFALAPIPLFSVSGTGDTVFDIPSSVARVRITGDYTKRGSNFIVWIDHDLVVNEIIGTAWESTHFEGTYLTGGGTVQIEKSSGVRWTFTEVR
jgi:hypothetical protein